MDGSKLIIASSKLKLSLRLVMAAMAHFSVLFDLIFASIVGKYRPFIIGFVSIDF